MEKHILKQYEDMKREYEDAKRRLQQTEKALNMLDAKYQVQDSVSGGIGGWQHFTIKGFPYPEYTRKKTLLNKRLARIEKLKADLEVKLDEVEQYIDAVPDSRKRLIMRYRYIDGMAWQQIATAMRITADSARKEIERYIEKEG